MITEIQTLNSLVLMVLIREKSGVKAKLLMTFIMTLVLMKVYNKVLRLRES